MLRAYIEAAVSHVRPSTNRNPELDGLRGVAVLLVLWAHLLTGVFPFNRPFLEGVPDLLPGGVSALKVIPKPLGDASLIPARADWGEKGGYVRWGDLPVI